MKFDLAIVVLTALSLVSCNTEKTELRKILRSFQNEEIEIPSDMLVINDCRAIVDTVRHGGPAFVMYFTDIECTDCAINHLRDYAGLFSFKDRYPVLDVLIVLDVPEDSLLDVVKKLEEQKLMFPVYLDINGKFKTMNIPKDGRFHSFLIDSDNKPVLVGNPIRSNAILDLFSDYLQKQL